MSLTGAGVTDLLPVVLLWAGLSQHQPQAPQSQGQQDWPLSKAHLSARLVISPSKRGQQHFAGLS